MGIIHAYKVARRLAKLVPDFKRHFFLILVCLLGVSFLSLPGPLLLSVLIDNVLPNHNVSLLTIVVLGLLLVQVLVAFMNLVNSLMISRLLQSLVKKMRDDLFKHFLTLPVSHYLETPTGKIVNRLTTETEEVGNFFQQMLWALPLPFFKTTIAMSVLAFWNWKMALYMMFSIPFTLFCTRGLTKKLRKLRQEQRDQSEEVQGTVTEAVDSIRVVRAFAREDAFDKELGDHAEKLVEKKVHHHFVASCLRSSNSVIQLASNYIFIIFGGYLVIVKELTLGEFYAFMYFQQILAPSINFLFEFLTTLPNQVVSIERALEVFDLPSEKGACLSRNETLTHEYASNHALRLNSLSLVYPDGTKALSNVSMSVNPGETVALVGPSGSGKSSLIAALLGFYSFNEGAISWGGVDLDKVSIDQRRELCSSIFQDAELFNRSVRYNMQLAKPLVSDDEIWRALEMAAAKDFIEQTQDGLNTIIGQKGIALSGGQKQRLSIARALLKESPLLILDEATSALDSISEKAIQQTLSDIAPNKMCLIVAHRLSTIAHADKIAVFNQGELVEFGPHHDLIKNKGVYANLYNSQMDGLLAWTKSNTQEQDKGVVE